MRKFLMFASVKDHKAIDTDFLIVRRFLSIISDKICIYTIVILQPEW